MQTDPFEARRRGARRLRLTTASLGAAAAVGTGALAWSVAADPADTATTTDEASTDESTTTTAGDRFVAPSQVPGSSSGSSHASSGGS
jgi:hypothetical protein